MENLQTEDNFKIIADYTSDLDIQTFNPLGTYAMVARSEIPKDHIKVADAFMLIKKLFGFSAVHSKISFEEQKFLSIHGMNPLELSNINAINQEIITLKEKSQSPNKENQKIAYKILQIRAKELKYIIYNNYKDVTLSGYTGYKALERYFEVITKY